jgi:16S rRNA (guanine527-N7)-methyltransferase
LKTKGKPVDILQKIIEYKDAKQILEKGLQELSKRKGSPESVRDPIFAETLMEMMNLVLRENEIINLTSITEPEEFVRLHLLDSLACVGLPELEKASEIIDVGSGCGFPGLPLAVLFQKKHFLLTDSLKKRIEFIEYAAKELNLRNVEVEHIRAEKAGQDISYRESFDLSICRAVGKLPVVLEYCMPLVRVGGAGIFYKTVPAKGEIEDSLLARELLGCSEEVRIVTYKDILPERGHALYIVEKSRFTPKQYPRREGIPQKVPL